MPPIPGAPVPPYAGAHQYPGGSPWTPRNYAGFWVRFGAMLLDGLLYTLLLLPFAIVSVVLILRAVDDCYVREDVFGNEDDFYCPPGAVEGGPLAIGIVVGAIGLGIVFYVYLRMVARTGQTWGRKAAGIKIVTEDGSPPGWGKAIGRTAFKHFISGSICYLGYLWMLWDRNKQTLHDKVAGTYVIRV